MGRKKKAVPAYRFHISGQAIVTLDGRDFYRGKHDSPESHARDLSLVAECWLPSASATEWTHTSLQWSAIAEMAAEVTAFLDRGLEVDEACRFRFKAVRKGGRLRATALSGPEL